MIAYEVEVRNLSEQINKLGRYDQIVNKRLREGMTSSVQTIERNAKMEAPVGVSGELRAKITHRVEGFGQEIKGIAGSYANYAVYVETGTRPHWAPIEPLKLWVQRKFGASGKEISAIAHAVQRAIARRGTKAQPYMKKGYNRSKSDIRKFFRRALGKIVDDIKVE